MTVQVDRLAEQLREHAPRLVEELRRNSDQPTYRLAQLQALLAGHGVPEGIRLAGIKALVTSIAHAARNLYPISREPGTVTYTLAREHDEEVLAEHARRIAHAAARGDWPRVERRLRAVLTHADTTDLTPIETAPARPSIQDTPATALPASA